MKFVVTVQQSRSWTARDRLVSTRLPTWPSSTMVQMRTKPAFDSSNKSYPRLVTFSRVEWSSNSRIQAQIGGEGRNEAVDSWLDIASFVANSSSRSPFEDLADKIGRECYVDIAGWHLFLKDVKVASAAGTTMAQTLGLVIGKNMASEGFDERSIEDVLRKVPISVGGGKVTVSLLQALPSICVSDLMDICKEYERNDM